jgi:F1F0 ATPase subunit 2
MAIEWHAVLLGFALGAPVSVMFFAGLAWGIKAAQRSARPGILLLLSSLCRIGVLMAVGFWITAAQDTGWRLAGFALAFFLVRLVAVYWVRADRGARNAAHTG